MNAILDNKYTMITTMIIYLDPESEIVIYSLFQTGVLGLWGRKVDAIEYYSHTIKELDKVVSHFYFSFLQYFNSSPLLPSLVLNF